MYKYTWDEETGGLLLTSDVERLGKEPRPVYYRELDLLGFDKFWNYPKDDAAPIMWAVANNYFYRGRQVAETKSGALYTPPDLTLLEEPEPNGGLLRPVDIPAMLRKNSKTMEILTQETIQKIYNTYKDYRKKVDLFYVAFSGGKDSVVLLDLVQRALPHDDFIVLFGDTGMEFSDTYAYVEKVKKKCRDDGINFQISRAEKLPSETWRIFGPPASVTRWCCGVHKTAPQILLLRQIMGKPNFTGMAFVGVRADESLSRSKYDFVSFGEKHKGQYSCNPILDWNSAEIFLYIWQRGLILNEAYKKGNRRAGCLICPKAAERNEYMAQCCYPDEVEPFVEIIRELYRKKYPKEEKLDDFIKNGGWKARKNGRDISIPINYQEKTFKDGSIEIVVDKPRTDWKTWIKTIGILTNDSSPCQINFQGKFFNFALNQYKGKIIVVVDGQTIKSNPNFSKSLKTVFKRAACCVGCRECQADCPFGCLNFVDGQVVISEKCHHCAQCHKAEKGCLVYKSLEMPKGVFMMGEKPVSLNTYSHHAPKIGWIEQYFEYKNKFDEKNNLGSEMISFFKRFLRDAGLLDKSGFTDLAERIEKIGLTNPSAWGILLTNLCCSPQIRWFVLNVNFNEEYKRTYLASMLVDSGAKESWTGDIFASLGKLCELPFGKIGLGSVLKEKNRAVSITRSPWVNPDSLVILYALYKFAERCGDYYQFSLSSLLDDSIERDGISPTRIFGLDRDAMIPILNGLSIKYPEFISASFTLGLETVNLRPEKSSADVLDLF